MKLLHDLSKYALVLCSIVVISTAQAKTMNDDDVRCPSVELVRTGAPTISDVTKMREGEYMVMGLFPFYSDANVEWRVAAEVKFVKDDEEAITKGREIIANVETRVSDIPHKDIFYMCEYYSGPKNNPTASVAAMGMERNKTALLMHTLVKQLKIRKM